MSALELKENIQKIGETFDTFKKGIEEQMQAKAANEDVSRVTGMLEKMNDRFDELETVKTQLEKLELKSGRQRAGGLSAEEEQHQKGFGDFMRKGRTDELDNLVVKSVSVGSEGDGGYAVPETLDTEIEKLEKLDTPMMNACRVINVSNESYRKLISLGGALGGLVGETGTRNETDSPKIAQVTPKFTEVYANPAATQKSLDDLMFNAESWLAEEVSETFSEIKNVQFTRGDGTGQNIKGLLAHTTALTDDKTRDFGTLQHRLSGAAGLLGESNEAILNNLIDLEMDLKTRYTNGAQYMLSKQILRQIRKLKDADGNLIWQPALAGGTPSTINTFTYIINDDMPGATDEGLSVAFGNFKRAYYVLNVRGRRVLRDPYTNKPFVHFYTTERFGGMLANSEAVKFLKLSAAG